MRVGRTTYGRYKTLTDDWWPPPSFQAAKLSNEGVVDTYERDDAPEWFSLADFPDLGSEWREVDTWPAGRLGLFERETEPLPRIATDGHRTGLEFENELHDMTATALPLLRRLFDGATVHTEFPYGWEQSRYQDSNSDKGRTDVVVCEFDWRAYDRRRRMVGTSTLNDRWGYFKSYRYIDRNGPFTSGEWMERGLYSDRYLKEIWEFLDENGYLATNGNFVSSYATVLPLPYHIEAAHAIELKQSTWEEALEQASRADYADYRWVALDAGHLRAAMENRDRFREEGIGLLGIGVGGAVEIVAAEPFYPDPEALDRADLRERSVAQLRPETVEEQPGADAAADVEEEADEADEDEQINLDAFAD